MCIENNYKGVLKDIFFRIFLKYEMYFECLIN